MTDNTESVDDEQIEIIKKGFIKKKMFGFTKMLNYKTVDKN